MDYISNSSKGINRNKNQDRLFIYANNTFSLFLVFDGVSSYSNSDKYIENFLNLLKSKLKTKKIDESKLGAVLFQIHKQLLAIDAEGMSTLSLVFINHQYPKKFFSINIGDSPIYSVSKQSLTKLTTDDVLNKNSNFLTKALGMESLSTSDFIPKENNISEKILLCSDGFAKLLEDDKKEYFSIFQYKRLSTIKRKIELMQHKKNEDDSTFILIEYDI